MTILAIDTSESHCSAALLLSGGTAVSRMEDIGRGHAERLLPMIEELFSETGKGYGDISRIAVVTGPGTFTGLRIGLSVARGLALVLGVPCVGLMSLPVLASDIAAGGGDLVHVVTKGRGGQVFYQAFCGLADGLPAPEIEPINADVSEVVEMISAKSGFIGGSGVHLLPESLLEGRESAVSAVSPIVLARLSEGLKSEQYPPEPTYLRQADAIKSKAVFQVRDD